MFVRVKSTPNSPRQSVQIVSSVRVGDKVKQKIVRYIGIAMDDDELVRLKALAEVVKAKLEAQHQPGLFPPEAVAKQVIEAKAAQASKATLNVDLRQMVEEQRVVLGIHEVYGAVYRQLSFDTLLPQKKYRASTEALFHCVMARIANPKSKRGSVQQLEQDFGVSLSLEKVYRMMDQLDDNTISRLQAMTCEGTRSLLPGALDVLFFDCTTLYFESFKEDELKQNGYSKDCQVNQTQVNQPQVLLALLVTHEGLPVGYEVFPGATFEGHSLISVLKTMQARYDVRKMIFVADRGMLNEDNLSALDEAGAYYIVGAKLKQLPSALQTRVLDKSAYQPLGKDGSSAAELTHKKRRLIVSHCPKRADKDQHDRQKAVDRLIKKIGKSQNPKDLLNNYGYKKFLIIKGKTSLSINQDKIAAESRWDGLHGVMTNLPDTPHQEVLSHYRGLWQVEESFRITKHDLKVRPIYHWTPSRVRAHIAISFMAFACIRQLMYRIKLQHKALSPEVIRNALIHVQHSVFKHKRTKQRYVMPAQINPEAKKIYAVMGLKATTTAYPLY